jgi:SMI1 / KNR4 family (SUKH-1)
MKPHLKLQRYWEGTGNKIATVEHSEDEIANVERRYGVRFPDDFREYLLRCCPRDEDNMDANGATWWTLDRIKNIRVEYGTSSNSQIDANAEKYFFFVDYLVWCEAWAIACTDHKNRGRVVVISGKQDRFVADSFSDFVDLYTKDDTSIY